MSTFNGIVHEFPDITIDFFHPHPGRRPPLACFLSHVHSDHLAGLETLRSPFIYCSAATREILLKLEKRPSRVAYAGGLREAPVRTYWHLKSLLKPIPLETPTNWELEPDSHIQVTLLDANHCPGAVMFLIEGNGKAILYTGDIRSEPWWVNSIARNPTMVEYSSGLKTLDRIYLDTSMLSDHVLQTKAEGLRELLSRVSGYPDDTIFCMQAWAYGYEEVWIALSKALKSKIHVDKYKMGVYKSLVAKSPSDHTGLQYYHHTKEAPYLVGFDCGNTRYHGCLTLDENVRIHSCEKGTACAVMENKPIVWLRPVVARLSDGQDIAEVGLGGGGDDLEQNVDLAQLTAENIQPLIHMISTSQDWSTEMKDQMKTLLLVLVAEDRPQLKATIEDFSEDVQTRLGSVIWSMVRLIGARQEQLTAHPQTQDANKPLPNRISFPYARHSSLPELQHLVETFRPKDIWPCTVDASHWEERGITMQKLFGIYCSADSFEHDILLETLRKEKLELKYALQEEADGNTQRTASSGHLLSSSVLQNSHPTEAISAVDAVRIPSTLAHHVSQKPTADVEVISIASSESSEAESIEPILPSKRSFDKYEGNEDSSEHEDPDILQDDSQASVLTARAYETRRRAFLSADIHAEDSQWRPIGLISTSDHHSELEEELGHS